MDTMEDDARSPKPHMSPTCTSHEPHMHLTGATHAPHVSPTCTQLTCHQEEEQHNDEGVAKVEQVGEEPSDGHLVDKVVDGEEH